MIVCCICFCGVDGDPNSIRRSTFNINWNLYENRHIVRSIVFSEITNRKVSFLIKSSACSHGLHLAVGHALTIKLSY